MRQPISAYNGSAGRTAGLSKAEPDQPFRSVQEAWFWTISCLRARREGARKRTSGGPSRPCQPDDVVKCLDLLYRSGRIDLAHARVLRVWGERGMRPDFGYHSERAEALLWDEAMTRLEWPLSIKGIVRLR